MNIKLLPHYTFIENILVEGKARNKYHPVNKRKSLYTFNNIQKIGTLKVITIIVLKMEQFGFIIHQCVQMMQMEWQTVQTLIRLLHLEQSDQGLRCLLKGGCITSGRNRLNFHDPSSEGVSDQ